jgi:hypothetical protein
VKRGGDAQRTTLTPRYNGEASGRAVLEEFPDRGIDIRSGAVNIVKGDPEGAATNGARQPAR